MGIKMAMRKGEISLDGYGRRKSFYGKCGVREVDGVLILRSYDTEYYAAAYNGSMVILSEYYTATSARHLDAFSTYARCEYHGKCGNGKRDKFNWHNLPRLAEKYASDTWIAAAVRQLVNGAKGNTPKAA